MYELVWGPPGASETPNVEREEVSTPDGLAALLARLDAQGRDAQPFIAILEHPQHGRLGIGLGSDLSIATFEGADGEPPYLISAGEPADADQVFFYEGEWSEFPAEAAVPQEAAREAMAAFLTTGERPENLTWTET